MHVNPLAGPRVVRAETRRVTERADPSEGLAVLVGDWKTNAPGMDAEGRTTFEWLEGGGFLIERSTVARPEFPNSVSIIGPTGPDGGLQQHYFDSRGVARVYEMTLANGTWTLFREGPDWPQRYVGRISDDGNTIAGAGSEGTGRGPAAARLRPELHPRAMSPSGPTACQLVRHGVPPLLQPAEHRAGDLRPLSSPITSPKCDADGKYS